MMMEEGEVVMMRKEDEERDGGLMRMLWRRGDRNGYGSSSDTSCSLIIPSFLSLDVQ